MVIKLLKKRNDGNKKKIVIGTLCIVKHLSIRWFHHDGYRSIRENENRNMDDV